MTSSIAKMLSYKPGTFSCCPASCVAWSSGSTADGTFFCLFDFHFEEPFGKAVFELQFSLNYGLLSITCQGPSGAVTKDRADHVLYMRKKELEVEGVKFVNSQPLDLMLLARDVINECRQILTQQDSSIFGSWRALCLCVHCHMCKLPDERYLNIAPTSGVWKPFADTVKAAANNSIGRLKSMDIEQLAVQSPYIFIGSERYGGKKPTLLLLKRVAAFMAWWRRQNIDARDQQKADLNASLAFELSLDSSAQRVYDLLVGAVRKCRAEMNYQFFTTSRTRYHSWPAGNVQEIAFSSEVTNWNPLPAWMKSTNAITSSCLLEKKPDEVHQTDNYTKGSRKSITSTLLPRENRLEGHFAEINMNGPTLSAHNELGGWGWPEFHPRTKGRPRQTEDFAAGISPRTRSNRIVAAEEGMVFQPFIKLNQRDFHESVDNITAKRFHLDFASASQQLYLRNNGPRARLSV